MIKATICIVTLSLLMASTGYCKYTPQKTKRDTALVIYTDLLNKAEAITNDELRKEFFKNGLKKLINGNKARQENASVLFKMSKSNSDSVKNFLTAICDSGFFIRTFAVDQSEMFYCFEKPNNQGMGKMYLSDRYPKGFFDQHSADNKFYVRDFDYSFPRIYFIRENEINILSGDNDLTDRKVFKRMPVASDTIFAKTATFRKNNNDEIYDFNYGFRYISYTDLENRWKRIALSVEDSNIVTKDWANYISFQALRNIINEKNIPASSLNVVLNDTAYEDHWFYAGTLTPFGEWLTNYTTIQSEKDVDSYRTDSTKSFDITDLIYVRQSPPNDYSPDKKLQKYKGDVSQSLEKKDKVFIKDFAKILDMKGNTSLWMKIRRVVKAEKK